MYYYKLTENQSPELVEKWKHLLKWFSKYSQLVNEKIITRGGSYYPRLTKTKKRGIRAFNELKIYLYNNSLVSNDYFDIVLKCREVPLIGICDICTKTDIINFLPFGLGEIEKSESPFELIEEPLCSVPFEEKVEVITDYFESLEFTPSEMAKTLGILNNYLSEVI